MSLGGSVVWLDGDGAQAARGETLDLLRSLGRPAAAVDEQDDAAIGLARAGVVTLRLGRPGSRDREEVDRASVPLHLVVAGEGDAPLDARRVLAAVDHGLEVATRPIFVIGMGRSGTTWVTDLLGGHPQVCALQETELFFEGRLWFLADPGSFDPDRSIPLLGMRRGVGLLVDRETAIADIRAVLARWLSQAVTAQHAWLAEKTPSLKNLEARVALFPDARFVCVMRDVRDVIVSYADARRSWMSNANWPRRATDLPREWRDGWAAVARLRTLAPVHVVRYEALHAAPEDELQRLFAFCEIPVDAGLASEIVAANRFETHADTGPHRFRRGGRVGDWRTQLGWMDRQLTLAVAGREMLAEGYLEHPAPAVLAGDAWRSVRHRRRLRRARGAR